MSIVFYHDEEQRRLAIESKEGKESTSRISIVTEIVPFSQFYLAEDYHQKYYLRHESDLFQQMYAFYPDMSDFINSTAVARLNGYIGGYGTEETFEEDIGNLGLSEKGKKVLLEIADRGLVPGCAVP